MANKEKSTQEVFATFMHSVHLQMNKDYWLDQRELGRINLVSKVEFKVDSSDDPCTVSISGYALDERELDAVNPYLRKFVFGNEITSFKKLIPALEKEYPQNPHLAELKNQWKQISERKWSFLASDQRTIGIPDIFDGKPLLWDESSGNIEKFYVSLLDTLEVYWYEGRLHAFDPQRNEKMRARIRTIEPNLLRRLQHIPLASTILMLNIAHLILIQSWPEATKYCGEQCYEHRRIREIMQENQ